MFRRRHPCASQVLPKSKTSFPGTWPRQKNHRIFLGLNHARHEHACGYYLRLLSSTVLVLETYRNLVRLSREGLLTAADFQCCTRALQEDMELFQLRDLTLDLCAARSMPVLSTPRSLDLAPLRTALWFHEQEKLTRFVSLDEGQILAAAEIGLPV